MKKKTIIIAAASALVLTAAFVLGFKLIPHGSDKPAEGESVLYANSVALITGSGSGLENRYAGITEAQNTLSIPLDSGQKVKTIFVKRGESVSPGTALFEYDSEEMSMNLEQAKLDLEKIQNSIKTYSDQITQLEKEKKQAGSEQQLSFTTQIQEAQMAQKQEEYNYKSKEMEIERLEKNLTGAVVTSTIAGVVQEINENPGFDNFTGEQKPFMSILGVGKYRVKGTINELNAYSISVGQSVIVRSRANAELVWYGTIDSISTDKPITNSGGGYYEGSGEKATRYPFYVTLDNSDGLMLGQHVYIEPDDGSIKKEGLWLLEDYVVKTEDKPFVWALNEKNRLEKRTVVLGESDPEDGTCEIKEGLSPSDYIVWPSDGCKPGAAATTESSGIMGPSGGEIDPGAEPGLESGGEEDPGAEPGLVPDEEEVSDTEEAPEDSELPDPQAVPETSAAAVPVGLHKGGPEYDA